MPISQDLWNHLGLILHSTKSYVQENENLQMVISKLKFTVFFSNTTFKQNILKEKNESLALLKTGVWLKN